MQQLDPDDIRALWQQVHALEREITTLKRVLQKAIVPGELDQLVYESYFPTEIIFHLTPRDYYRTFPAAEPYLPEAYAKDGFIHCTRGADLLAIVANRYYKTLPGDMLMLVIDVRALTSPLKYELSDGPVPFPHIYGPVNRDAIVEVVPMSRADDGTFLVPPYTRQDR